MESENDACVPRISNLNITKMSLQHVQVEHVQVPKDREKKRTYNLDRDLVPKVIIDQKVC